MENFANIKGLCGAPEGDENGGTYIWSAENPDRWARENLCEGLDFFDLSDGGDAQSFDEAAKWVLEQQKMEFTQ